MFMNGDPLHTRSLAPQPPLPPEIEGYLKKLKRKTSNITGSWNKRWFFVDPKRLEFGYAASKAPNAPRSSIYLNDITAVVQFDDTQFQVESRTRNFFLCGESKASTTCWVKSLDEYRKKLIEYDREMLQFKAAASGSTSSNETNQSKIGAESNKNSHRKKKSSLHDNPARDSLQDSSSSASLSINVSSSSNLADEKLPRHINVDDAVAADEKRTASPIEATRRRELRESKARGSSEATVTDRSQDSDSKSRDRGRDRGRDREGDRESRDRRSRESDRDREHSTRARDRDADDERHSKRDRSTSAQRRGNTGATSSSSSQASAGRTGSRTSSGKSAYGGHPTHGYVMHAWMDEYE